MYCHVVLRRTCHVTDKGNAWCPWVHDLWCIHATYDLGQRDSYASWWLCWSHHNITSTGLEIAYTTHWQICAHSELTKSQVRNSRWAHFEDTQLARSELTRWLTLWAFCEFATHTMSLLWAIREIYLRDNLCHLNCSGKPKIAGLLLFNYSCRG